MSNVKTRIRRILESKWYTFVLILAMFLLFFLYQIRAQITYTEYFFDIADYVVRGEGLWKNGHFSLRNFENGFRGYLFPLMVGSMAYLDEHVLNLPNLVYPYRVLSSALYSGAYYIFAKCIVYEWDSVDETIYHKNRKVTVTCVFMCATTGVFFNGLIMYPLSDLPAVCLAFVSSVFIIKAMKESRKVVLVEALLAGCFAYMTYNVRPIYIFFIILSVIFMVIESRSLKKLVALLVMYGIGVFIAGIPQLYVNYWVEGTATIWVLNDSLFTKQLFWGLKWMRYEAYVGNQLDYLQIEPTLKFVDPVGVELLKWYETNISNEYTINGYIRLALHFPLDYLGIMGRHLISLFFPIFHEQYPKDIYENRSVIAIASLILWYFAIMISAFKAGYREWNKKMVLWYIMLCFPSFVILAGAVEQRFFVMIYVLLTVYVVRGLLRRSIRESLKRYWGIEIVGFIIFSVVLITMESSVLSGLEYFTLLWNPVR